MANDGGFTEEILLTLDEAARFLDPPISREDLKALVEVDRVPARGTRRKHGPGRPALTYRLSDLARVHAANVALRHEFAATGVS